MGNLWIKHGNAVERNMLTCLITYKSPTGAPLRLQQYVQGVSSPLVVLQNFPSVDSQAHAFIAARVAMAVVAVVA